MRFDPDEVQSALRKAWSLATASQMDGEQSGGRAMQRQIAGSSLRLTADWHGLCSYSAVERSLSEVKKEEPI
jgi:hypothetical protein